MNNLLRILILLSLLVGCKSITKKATEEGFVSWNKIDKVEYNDVKFNILTSKEYCLYSKEVPKDKLVIDLNYKILNKDQEIFKIISLYSDCVSKKQTISEILKNNKSESLMILKAQFPALEKINREDSIKLLAKIYELKGKEVEGQIADQAKTKLRSSYSYDKYGFYATYFEKSLSSKYYTLIYTKVKGQIICIIISKNKALEAYSQKEFNKILEESKIYIKRFIELNEEDNNSMKENSDNKINDDSKSYKPATPMIEMVNT